MQAGCNRVARACWQTSTCWSLAAAAPSEAAGRHEGGALARVLSAGTREGGGGGGGGGAEGAGGGSAGGSGTLASSEAKSRLRPTAAGSARRRR